MHSRFHVVRRITTFTTGVALGLSILSGPASAAPATPSDPSPDNRIFTADGRDPVDLSAGGPGDSASDDAAAPAEAALSAAEATLPDVVDPTGPTPPPAIVDDDPEAPPTTAAGSQAVISDTASVEVRPARVAVRGIPASPVVALAPGNWGISARVVGVRKAPRVQSFDTRPAPQVLALRITREDTLPRTGMGTGLLTMVAALLLVVGTVLTRTARAPHLPAATPRRRS